MSQTLELEEAKQAEANITEDVYKKIKSFTNEVFVESLDEEMIAFIICHKALSKLHDLSKANVINLLRVKLDLKARTEKQLLEEMIVPLRHSIEILDTDLKAQSREIIQRALNEIEKGASENTPEENKELLESLKD